MSRNSDLFLACHLRFLLLPYTHHYVSLFTNVFVLFVFAYGTARHTKISKKLTELNASVIAIEHVLIPKIKIKTVFLELIAQSENVIF